MTTMPEPPAPDAELLAARQWLRARQAESPLAGGRPRGASTLAGALRHLSQFLKVEPTATPGLVRRGGLRYVLELEEQRVRLAAELLARVDPGPDEDPRRLALLAYEAASLELALRDLRPDDQRWAKFLLGTLYDPVVNAFAGVFSAGGYTAVALDSGLIDFLYQATKILVAVQHPASAADRRWYGTTSPGPEDVEAELDRNPEPAERLYRTLEACFFQGYPRAFFDEAVFSEHVIPVSITISLAERWIIAHEFGHAFAAGVDFGRAPNPQWQEELFADLNATVLTVLSADGLDRLPPEFALASAVFALACRDVLDRAIALLRGEPAAEVAASGSHPPSGVRARTLVQGFRRLFDVTYDDGASTWELTPRFDREEAPGAGSATYETHVAHAFEFANGLFAVWKRVRGRLLKDRESGRPLHPMWR